jgi:hypothetical protein
MESKKAFVVVGHRHWGKSTTLRELADGKYSALINGQEFAIKRMSNDDPPVERLLEFIRKAKTSSKALLIIALCPDFYTDDTITTVLKELKGYDLLFWVIQHSQNPNDRPPRRIPDSEIEALRRVGKVEVFSRKDSTAAELANALRRFIKNSFTDA